MNIADLQAWLDATGGRLTLSSSTTAHREPKRFYSATIEFERLGTTIIGRSASDLERAIAAALEAAGKAAA